MSETEHSRNFEKIKGYFDNGFWSKKQVHDAAIKERITKEEYEEITGTSAK